MTYSNNQIRFTKKSNPIKLILLSQLLIFLTIISCNTLLEKDYSLKPEEYQKYGMPDSKKTWTSDEYTAANITISTLNMKAPRSLPRSGSKKSGELFNRLTDEENLDFIYDTTAPIKMRAFVIQHYPRMISEIESMYTLEYKGKLYYREELLRLKAFKLSAHNKMLELGMIIESSDDESLSDFKNGLRMVKNNYLIFVPGLLDDMVKPEFKSADGLEKLSKAVSASVLKNSVWMTPVEKNKLLSKFRSVEKTLKSSKIKDNLMSSVTELSK